MFEDSRTKVFVCNVTNAAGAASIPLLPAQSGSFYVDPQTQKEDVIAAVPTRFVYRNTRGVLSQTPYFTIGNVHNAGGLAYAARAEQITYLGYNGVAGSMDATNSTYYGLKVILKHTFGLLNNSPMIVTIPYKSSAAATQREVASGLAVAGTNWLKRQAYKPFMVERVNSGAQLLVHNNIALVHGSKTIVSADDDTLTLLNGTVIRVPDTVDGAPSMYDPCYVIVSNDGGAGAARIYTLDQEYQGTSKPDHDTVETVTEGNWGLKFTGISVADADFNPVTDEPFVSSFELEAGDFTTATVTYGTNIVGTGAASIPYPGTGTYQLVSALEARGQFENKTREVSAYPPTVRNIDAIAGTTYDCVSFELWFDQYASPTTGTRPVSKDRYVIFYEHSIHAAELFDVVMGVDF